MLCARTGFSSCQKTQSMHARELGRIAQPEEPSVEEPPSSIVEFFRFFWSYYISVFGQKNSIHYYGYSKSS